MTLKRVRSIIKVTTSAAGVGAENPDRHEEEDGQDTDMEDPSRPVLFRARKIRFRAAGRKTTQSPVRTIQLPIAMPRILK